MYCSQRLVSVPNTHMAQLQNHPKPSSDFLVMYTHPPPPLAPMYNFNRRNGVLSSWPFHVTAYGTGKCLIAAVLGREAWQ